MIICVAIKDTDGNIWSLPKPNRHGDVVALMRQNKLTQFNGCISGFMNDKDVFLTRDEAWFEASECNQILPAYNPINPNERCSPPRTEPGPLFSEDIW